MHGNLSCHAIIGMIIARKFGGNYKFGIPVTHAVAKCKIIIQPVDFNLAALYSYRGIYMGVYFGCQLKFKIAISSMHACYCQNYLVTHQFSAYMHDACNSHSQ